jgi:hypothetical protein
MGQLFEIVKQFFRDDDWGIELAEGQTVLRTMFGSKDGQQWMCYAHVLEEQGYVVFYSIATFEVPQSRRMAVAEHITRINFGSHIGGFELNMNDGMLQFKTSVDVSRTEQSLTPILIKNLVYNNVLTMEHYLPTLQEAVQ